MATQPFNITANYDLKILIEKMKSIAFCGKHQIRSRMMIKTVKFLNRSKL